MPHCKINSVLEPFIIVDPRPQLNGWAPGNYTNSCLGCGSYFTGDKRAVECAPCAYGDNDGNNTKK